MFTQQQLHMPQSHVHELNQFFEVKDHMLTVQDDNARKMLSMEQHNWPKHCVDLLLHQMGVTLDKDHMIKIDETSKKSTQPPHADKGPGWHTVIVPLRWYDPVYTVMFEQYYHGTYFRGYKYRPSGKQMYEKEWLSQDHDAVHGLTGQPFDQNHYQRYFYGTCDAEDFHGLTVHSVAQWQQGQGIWFAGNQLHAGSSFQVSKRWLVVHWEE